MKLPPLKSTRGLFRESVRLCVDMPNMPVDHILLEVARFTIHCARYVGPREDWQQYFQLVQSSAGKRLDVEAERRRLDPATAETRIADAAEALFMEYGLSNGTAEKACDPIWNLLCRLEQENAA